MIALAAAGAVLVGACVVLHYEILRLLGRIAPRVPIRARARVLVVVLALFLAHAIEIALYALAYLALVRHGGFGSIGAVELRWAAALYFSAETYTSLGFGDLAPLGDLRLLAGGEALNGLLLIGWSASYLHLEMVRDWALTGSVTPGRE